MESPDRLDIDRSHRSPPLSHIRVGLETSSAESRAIVLYRKESEKEVIPREGKYFTLPRRQMKPAPSPFCCSHFDSDRTPPLSPASSNVQVEAAHKPSVTDPGGEQACERYHKSPSQWERQTYRLTSSVSGHSMLIRRFCIADCHINRASRSFLTRLMFQSPPPERQQRLYRFHKTLMSHTLPPRVLTHRGISRRLRNLTMRMRENRLIQIDVRRR